MKQSESIKTVVETVLKFSNGLQALVDMSTLLWSLSDYEVGSVRIASLGCYPILFQSRVHAVQYHYILILGGIRGNYHQAPRFQWR